MLRTILGIIVGAVVGGAVVYGWEMVGHMIWPLPPGIDFDDPEQLKTLMLDMPLPAILWVAAGFGVGIFAGSSAANWVAKGNIVAGWIVAVLLFAGAMWSVFAIPHPVWFGPLTVVVCGLGGWLAQRWQGRKA